MKIHNQKLERPIAKVIGSCLLGLGMNGFFSIPALAEATIGENETTANIAKLDNVEADLSSSIVNSEDREKPAVETEILQHDPQPVGAPSPTDLKTADKLNKPAPTPQISPLLTAVPDVNETNLPASIVSSQDGGEPVLQVDRATNEVNLSESVANSGIQGETASEESEEQVTSVSQLSDVQPTDWAFGALQSLVERYGCIAGYPDGTYRGNRALTRYEFAAGLNACLDKIQEIIGTGNADRVKQEDLLALQKLQEEFAADLAVLRGRVDLLEARSTELEANQFSTTVKLSGLTIVGIQGRTPNRGDISPRDGKRDTKDPGTNVNTINLNQFYLTAQFSPRSNLLIGFYNQNGSTSPQLTDDTNVAYNFAPTSGLTLSDLNYR